MILTPASAQAHPHTCPKPNSLLAFDLGLRERLAHFFRDKVMPLELPCRALAHCGLPSPKLSDSLQLLDGFDRLLEELAVGVALRRFIADRFEQDRVFLQVLRRAAEEVFEVQSVCIGVPRTLLDSSVRREHHIAVYHTRIDKPQQIA